MKTQHRLLGSPIPPFLILTPDGTIQSIDSSDVVEYLKTVYSKWGKEGNIDVVIAPKDSIERLEADVILANCQSA